MDTTRQQPADPKNSSSTPFRLLQAGPRPREVTASTDLLSHFQLRDTYNSFSKKEFHKVTVADSGYLSRVVGETEIRRGVGMELGQLIDEPAAFTDSLHVTDLRPLDLEFLRGAFTFKENAAVFIPEAEKGLPTISGSASGKERKKRRKEKDKDKSKDKHRDKKEKDKKDKDKKEKKQKKKKKRHREEKEHGGENGEDSHRKHKKKKRREEGGGEGKEGDREKRKKKKHKHSKSGDAEDSKKNGW
ncbi:hypothetical protein CBR_g48048 [Chara braunii]|uniref:Mediator of RNA polymerase II transcription subunit 19 n=1 Tax=Chara braunii TaxID=69332 RepID=A0A388M273_CHABU|nr:hypothetical protein CBR_g48048 [Chara braunii]|eukprot:GBG88579.1 hypothetical protein CBR_g48048 [Chara braunii]